MKRFAAFLLTALLLATDLCACGTEINQANKPESGEITLRFWAFPTFAQENPQDAPGTYEQKLIRAYEKAHPGVRVELTMLDFTTGPEKLSRTIGTKDSCDVLFDAPGRIIAYGKEGYLESLDDLFDEEFCADVRSEALLGACRDGDTAYMYPISSAPFYMAFNKAMLEDAGVAELVKEGWTTDDFTEALTSLHSKGYVPGSVFCKDQGGDQATRAFVANLFDSSVTDESVGEYTIADDGGKKAVRYIKDCVDKGLLLNGTYMNGSDAIFNFVNGRASFTLLWGPSQQNSNSKLLEDNGIEIVEVPFPSEDGKAELEYLVNGFCVMNNGDSAKADAAKDFVRYLCDDAEIGKANAVRTGCIPVRTSFGNLYAEERMEKIMDWTQYYAPYYNTVDGFTEMRSEWSFMLREMLNGYVAPKTALEAFAGKANLSLVSTD